MSDIPFRIKIYLNKIFQDHRKEAYVYVDSSFRYVHHLEEHIRRLFDIEPKIYLTIDGNLLPKNENIYVIPAGEDIMVNTFSQDKGANDTIDEDANGTIDEDANGTIDEDANGTIDVDKVSIHSSTEFDFNSKKSSERNVVSPFFDAKFQINPAYRKKRIRKRKRKSKKEIEPEIEKDSGKAEVTPTISFPVREINTTLVKPKSHIRFCGNTNEEGSTIFKSDHNDSENISKSSHPIVSDSTNVFPSLARKIRPLCVYSESSITKAKSAPEHNKNIAKFNQSLVTLRSFANDANFKNISHDLDFEVIRETVDDNKNFAELEGNLQTTDIIVFKILKINESYTPELSKWIVGMVIEVDEKNISVHILAGREETTTPTGKLSMDISDENTDSSSDKVTFSRSEILTTKVFKPVAA